MAPYPWLLRRHGAQTGQASTQNRNSEEEQRQATRFLLGALIPDVVIDRSGKFCLVFGGGVTTRLRDDFPIRVNGPLTVQLKGFFTFFAATTELKIVGT